MKPLTTDERAAMRTLKWRPVAAAIDDVVLSALAARGFAWASGSGALSEWRMTPEGADLVMGRQRMAA